MRALLVILSDEVVHEEGLPASRGSEHELVAVGCYAFSHRQVRDVNVEKSIREILDNYLNLDKGKINLSAAEGTQIITDLRKKSDPYHDADGRLILVRISQNELRKMFKKGE